MTEDSLYPDEIRRYEKEIIEFIIESGKDKRSSEVESHILAYFFLHPHLTQARIQELSRTFRKKEISLGSISKFLNQYEEYGIIEKETHPEKKTTFIYSLKQENMQNLSTIALSAGIKNLKAWILEMETYVRALSRQTPFNAAEKDHQTLLSRVREIRNFFIFHSYTMQDFFSGDFQLPTDEDLDISTLNIEDTISEDKINQLKNKDCNKIEKEIVQFLVTNPLFILDQSNYIPIYCQLMLHRRMTQNELRKTTRLSSGTISEGLQYLIDKDLARLAKLQGIRKRFYCIPSIGYSNYLKQYHRFQRIKNLRERLERVQDEMMANQEKLSTKPGYERVLSWVNQFISQYQYIDQGLVIFQKAIDYFRKKINKTS